MELGMIEALKEAQKAKEEGEIPVGAVILKDGKIIARAHNHREAKNDISSHAEIEAMRQAANVLGSWSLEGCLLYVTLEPCLMCLGAIFQARISTLVYGADDPSEGALSAYHVPVKNQLLVYRGEGKEGCEGILKDFFAKLR